MKSYRVALVAFLLALPGVLFGQQYARARSVYAIRPTARSCAVRYAYYPGYPVTYVMVPQASYPPTAVVYGAPMPDAQDYDAASAIVTPGTLVSTSAAPGVGIDFRLVLAKAKRELALAQQRFENARRAYQNSQHQASTSAIPPAD